MSGAWRKREGKRYAFEIGLVCSIIALICLFIAFVSPYWVISWPRVHSEFKRLGLWEVCFAGLVLPTDPTQKSYHGCWWILAPEFYAIRGWLFPSYFVFIQVMVTLCLCAEIVAVGIMGYCWMITGGTQLQTEGKPTRRDNICLIQTATVLTLCSAVGMTVSVVEFASMVYVDRYWLPHPYLNYLSWSYGLALVSTFFSIFSSIAQVLYVIIMRRELIQPPKSYEVPLKGQAVAETKMNTSQYMGSAQWKGSTTQFMGSTSQLKGSKANVFQ